MAGGRAGRLAAFVLADVATGDATFARSLYLLPVLGVATRARAADVAAVAVAAIVPALLSPVWNDACDHVSPLITLLAGSAIAVWGARERHAAITARRRPRPSGASCGCWPRRRGSPTAPPTSTRRCGGWSTCSSPTSPTRPGSTCCSRAAACGGSPRASTVRTTRSSRPGCSRADLDAVGDLSPTTRALRGEGSQLAELDERLRDAIVHDDADDRRLMELSDLRWTMALPLAPSGGPLGALGLGVGRSGRRYGPAELAFAELLVGRAGLALANAQLVNRLTATQRRLDGILGALAEAVTVHDARGGGSSTRTRPPRSCSDCRACTPCSTAAPGELAGRFDIRYPDGTLGATPTSCRARA